MIENHRNYHGKYILTLIFASVLLISFGAISHNAFADQVIATIPVNGAFGVATNPNTDMTYVATGNGYQVQVINDKTNTVTTTIQTRDAVNVTATNSGGCKTLYVTANQDTNMIYAYNGGCQYVVGSYGKIHVSPTISVINGFTNKIVANMSLPSGGDFGSFPITVNPATNKIYAINPAFGVYVIDGETNAVTLVQIEGPSCLCDFSDVAVNPQTNMIYVLGAATNNQGNISVIDGASNSVVTTFSWGGFSQNGVGVNPITNKIYVSNSDISVPPKSVSVIDGSTYQVINTIPNANYGYLAVNPVTNKIYVADGGYYSSGNGNTVSIIDGQTNTLFSKVEVGQFPFGIGINTVTNKIYVGNTVNKTISVIDGGASTAPSPPTGLTATAVSSSQINLSWNAPSDNGGSIITGYKIERSTNNGSTWSTVQPNTISSSTTYNDTGLAPSTSYTYRVSSISDGGTSIPSNTASATTMAVLTVKAIDVLGNPINGIWMEIHSANGDTIASGYTPVTFDVKQGAKYAVYASNYLHYVFLHWDDGSMTNPKNITPAGNEILTATYTP